MEKENLEIRKASEELTAEDLKNVNGGLGNLCCNCSDCRKNDCQKHCNCD